ncbi:MAG: hypothetical protein IT307_14810, partial [Chloroflexi bacterium]|nr:hypothetical protein [Chloroflexota bacterium]
NLALVLTGAMATTLCVGLAANVLACLRRVPTPRRADWVFGLLAGFLVMVAGNLDGPLEILAARGFNPPGFWGAVGIKNLKAAPSGNWLPVDGGWWWHGSRVIPTIQPDGITEFPYFSFLLGDLHPHFTALALDLLVLALVLALLLEGTPRTDWPWRIVSGLALGVLIAANTWDVATFWLLFGVASALVLWRAAGDWRIGWRVLGPSLWPIGIAIAGYFPYFIGYSSQRLGLAFVTSGFTPLVSVGIIFGPMLALCLLLVLRPAVEGRGVGAAAIRPVLVSVMVAIILLAAGRQTLAVAAGLLGLLLVRAWGALRSWSRADGEAGRSVRSGGTAPAEAALVYSYLLAGLGVAIVAAVEVIYIRDVFGTRMNTVFKFYYHAWVLLGLAGAVAAGLWCLRTDWSWRPATARVLAGGLTATVVGLGLVYPVASTMSKSSGYRQPTLDGMAFLSRARPGEAEAIRWLSSQAGRPVVLEAVGPAYSEFARVATFSGLPTVLGWDNHESQWRGPLVEFAKRKQDVETIYRRGDAETALPILQRYGVRYVFVGGLEREAYGRDVESRFARWLEPVFRREGVAVFVVPSVGGET